MNKAYTTIDALISCLILTITIMLVLPFQKSLVRIVLKQAVAHEIGVMKLQLILAQSNIKSVKNEELALIYEGEKTSIVIEKQRIVKKPGYHILFYVDKEVFKLIDQCIYLGEEKIYCEKGLR